MSKRTAVISCNDCGVDIIALGEYYMLRPEIWETQLGLGWNDNLCIGCLEARLGRRVSMRDMFFPLPQYPWLKPPSIRLTHRLFRHGVTKRPPYRWRKSFLKNTSGLTLALAKIIGELRDQ